MVGKDGQERISGGRQRVAGIVGAFFVVASTQLAAAQNDAARQYMTITADEALVRCAAGTYYYPITRLTRGETVAVLGTDGDWVRVEYPEGSRAFISADVAERGDDGVRVVEPTRLKAANLNYGFRGSWKAVFDEPLPAGTTLKLVEPVVDEDGMTRAFLVEAPSDATGFIMLSSMRMSTPEEIAQFKASLIPESKPDTQVAEAPEQTPKIIAVPTDDAQADALEGPSALETETHTPIEQPVIIAQTPIEEQVGPTSREVASPAALESAFETVFRQDVIEAEYDELIAEFNRAIETVDVSTDDGRQLRRRLQQRVDVLALKRDLQVEQRALAEATRQIDQEAAALAGRVAELSQTHAYSIVGRLVPSTVYDGKRLPRMYRIQSVGQAVPRTLGYVRPEQAEDVTSMLGEVVGVVGDARLDRSLKLRVVRPERIDVLAPTIVSVPDDDG